MSKRKIPRAIFEPLEHVECSNLVESEPLLDLIKKETVPAIRDAHESKKTFATIFEINGLGFYLDIPKQYWIPALEQCIAFMLEEEKFEECIPIKKLIDEIKKPIKSLPKKTSKKNQDGTASK